MAVYYPYFRGRQNELLAIRHCAGTIARSDFVPIIEPVKESFKGLERALDELQKANAKAVVIGNPEHGDHSLNSNPVVQFLSANYPQVEVGIMARQEYDAAGLANSCKGFLNANRDVTLIHAGFSDGLGLSNELGDAASRIRHVYVESRTGRLYRSHFRVGERVLLGNGFEQRINRKHPPLELFSDLHLTYPVDGMNGFGDYLMVGDEYSESGGPAYAVAIHLTFIDPKKEQQMFIHHFVSDTVDTPTDPAGKFAEALEKLVREVNAPGSPIFRSTALAEFLDLHLRQHFPGLGSVKKLSMIHHIETLADFFSQP